MTNPKFPTQKAVILVVDDELDVLLPLADILQRLLPNAAVFPAESARAALDFACDRRVDLVISDQRMPGMTGEQLLRVLGESRNKPATILMTAYPRPGLAFRAETESNLQAMFSKPFDATVLAHKASAILDARLGRKGSAAHAA